MASVTTTVTAKQLPSPTSTKLSSKTRPTALAVDIPSNSVYQSWSSDQKHFRPPSPHRTFSDPLPSASPLRQFSSILGRSADDSPKSAGHAPKGSKNVKFGRREGMSLEKSATAPAPGRKEMVKRRHSHDPRMNVHTSCGRHSDDWLFGGFSIAGVVKKIWDKKEEK